MTETASTTTFNPSADQRRAYSVGKPIWGTQTRVWDDQGRPLPPGPEHAGEVVTRGMHVMKGYLNRPEATAEAFTGGWLHAGDLGYVDEDGFLFIVSRKKELIIRGGYNVYPGEIENVLHAHPAVAGAAVVGVPGRAARRGSHGRGHRAGRDGTGRARARHLVPGAAGRLQVPAGLPVPRRAAKVLKDELAASGGVPS
jgi:acyl-CoA synthetase (AMP-forming)/AMP-acid ligase II